MWTDRLALFSSQLPPAREAEEGMTMDTDECHSELNLARQSAVPKLAVRQLGCLIGIYMSPLSATSYLL